MTARTMRVTKASVSAEIAGETAVPTNTGPAVSGARKSRPDDSKRVQERSRRGFHGACRRHGLLSRFGRNVDLPVEDAGIAEVDFEVGGPGKRALDQGFRERILDVLLQG